MRKINGNPEPAVTPAKAGVQIAFQWMPAFAGMTSGTLIGGFQDQDGCRHLPE
ncbi:MAG: hypothetical protein J0H15_07625 [Xanthomonadales bacterium]|nr:hypothetical protein [Xanthomonadales bacterium]